MSPAAKFMNRGSDTTALTTDGADAIPPEAISAELDKVLKSTKFAASKRLRALLSLIVHHSLEGNAAILKETVIGAELFGRPPEYDPRADSIVRTTAQRLRMDLNAYYATEGANDPIIITLPKGHYRPHFTRRPTIKLPVTVDLPVVGLPRSRISLSPRVIALCALGVVAVVVFLVVFNAISDWATVSRTTPAMGRLFLKSTSEGKAPTRLDLGYEAGWLLVTPDGRTLYAVEFHGRSVTALGVGDLRVKQRIELPHPASSATMSKDGKHFYVGSQDSVVMVVRASSGRIDQLIPTRDPVFDLAVTPDEKKIFLALGTAGLDRIALPLREAATLSPFACPLYLAMDPEGKRLLVSYQCGGPGGHDGHDVVEIYDPSTESRINVVRDLPLVGGRPLISPTGDLVMLDALDACITRKYDQIGCPASPAHVFHLFRALDRGPDKSFALPVRTNGASFSPDGRRVIFGGDPLVVMDWAKQTITETAPSQGKSFSKFAFSATGGRTFLSSTEQNTELLVFDAEGRGDSALPAGLMNHYSGDGNLNDSVGVSAPEMVGSVTFRPGLVGQAFAFSGNGALLAGKGGTACWPCSGAWTESLFFKLEPIDAEMTLLEREGPSDRWRHRFFLTKDHRLHLQLGAREARRETITVSNPVEPNRWYHIALVAAGFQRSFYLDGVLQRQADLGGAVDDGHETGMVCLGMSLAMGTPLHGLLDEIMWHGRALDEREVKTLAAYRP